MKIQFNKVTWYSKLIAVLVFLLVFGLGFHIGRVFESVRHPVLKDMTANPATATRTISGTLVEGGIECPAFKSDEGKTYTLTGDLAGHKIGDRVKITGTIAEVSTCMQGITINVTKVQ